MRVGPIGPGWWVRCAVLGTDRRAWDAPGTSPVVRVGTANESGSRFYSFVLTDCQNDLELLEVRAASTVGGLEPTCFAERGRLFVLTDGWVSEVDALACEVAWEHLADAPLMAAWLAQDGWLIAVSEIDVVALDPGGHTMWQHTVGDLVHDFRRDSPQLQLTSADGSQVIIDERTGAVRRTQ